MSSITGILKAVKNASRKLNLLDVTTINSILMSVADEAEKEVSYLLNENKRDLEAMDKSNPKYD